MITKDVLNIALHWPMSNCRLSYRVKLGMPSVYFVKCQEIIIYQHIMSSIDEYNQQYSII